MVHAAGPSTTARHGAGWWVTAILTVLGMLGALLLYVASGLLAPLWAMGGLLVLWLVLSIVAVRLHPRHSAWALLVPVAAVVVLVAVLTAGQRLLGWTA